MGGDASDGGVDVDQTETPLSCTPGHQRVELGEISTDATGRSGVLEFQAPPCTRSFVITVMGDPRYHYTLAELTPVGGLSLVPKAWLDVSASPVACLTPCANRIIAQPAAAAFLFPNNPLIEVGPGAHVLRVYAFKRAVAGKTGHLPVATQAKVHLDFVLGPGSTDAQLKLPVNLCLTGASGLSGPSALQHPRVVAALVTFAKLLAPAGVVAEPVRVFDVADKHRFINTIEGTQSDLSALFRAGAGLPLGLNVFLVERIDVSSGGPPGTETILGLSGGIPGPPRQMGCDRCGVVFGLAVVPGQPDLLGELMAHEISHYLGLFHSTEPPGSDGKSIHDNLLDTKPGDPTNLMYWAVTDQSTVLTAQQRAVLRLSPWLLAP